MELITVRTPDVCGGGRVGWGPGGGVGVDMASAPGGFVATPVGD
ncbi:MAG TPA: hypothetical protein VE219_05155 [Candidatus Sulfotelmatobacter sp.]|nr:hypothetical protein [Candidatus Sulfotelmatobacter sp.]